MAEDRHEWQTAEQVVRGEFDAFRGRLLGAIESAGLPERQEIALKTALKGHTYQMQGLLEEVVNTFDEPERLFRVGPQLETVRSPAHDVVRLSRAV
jgi:hypothetical protein